MRILEQISKNSIMKTIIYFFVTCLSFLNTLADVHAQNTNDDKQAVQMLKDFYTAWAVPKDKAFLKKIDPLLMKYVTGKLKNDQKEEGLEHDLLTNDHQMDAEHLKTLTVTKDPAKVNEYIVSFIDHTLSAANEPVDEKVVLYVRVIKQAGVFKIVKVWWLQ
jgi:hypothetical protein